MIKIEELSLYLPHKLRVGQHYSGKIESYLLYGIKFSDYAQEWTVFIDDSKHGNYQNVYLKGVKPIFTPFNLIESISERAEVEKDLHDALLECDFKYLGLQQNRHIMLIHGIRYFSDELPANLTKLFAKYHYDIFNLIEKESAYDKTQL